MDKLIRGSLDLPARHELDRLPPTSTVHVGLATDSQSAALVAIARREIPGIGVSEEALAQYVRIDPETIFAFERSGNLLGGIAFLYLNDRGHDALLLGGIDLKTPSREFLARPDEGVSAIYVWALACHGRAAAGLGNVAAHLRGARFVNADYFAQPATTAGRDLLIAIGFRPMSSFQPDLWFYQRPWHRFANPMPASNVPVRSFADARH